MLVLERKTGESIMIGHNIKVTILGVDEHVHRGRVGRRVKVGIEAPTDVPINRSELLEGGDHEYVSDD